MAFANPAKLLFATLPVEWNTKIGNTKLETPAPMFTVISKMMMIKVFDQRHGGATGGAPPPPPRNIFNYPPNNTEQALPEVDITEIIKSCEEAKMILGKC